MDCYCGLINSLRSLLQAISNLDSRDWSSDLGDYASATARVVGPTSSRLAVMVVLCVAAVLFSLLLNDREGRRLSSSNIQKEVSPFENNNETF